MNGTPADVERLRARLGEGYRIELAPEAGSPDSLDLADANHARTLLRCLSEGICLGSPEGKILWSNEFFRALPESCRRRVEGLCREAATHLSTCLAQGLESDGSLACKFEVRCQDTDRDFDVFVTPVSEADEKVPARRRLTGVAVIVRDVTEIRRAQRKMDAIDRAGYELVRLDTDQLKKLNAYERLQLLEEKIVTSTRQTLHYDHFAVFLIDERRRKLELIVSEGLPEEIQDLDLYIESEGSGISGYVAKTGASYICHDATTDERFLPGLSGARSSLTVPLRLQDKVIGVMDIESAKPHAFTDEDRQFVEIFARHIALALHLLDLLVAERSTTNLDVSGRFEGELSDPLEDIASEVDWLRATAHDPEASEHIAQIMSDVESIRRRMRDVASGPQTLLGVDRAMLQREQDPALTGKRVLVADDAAKVRKVIGEILAHRGASVEVVERGADAIAALQRAIDGSEPPFDLIISDIQMPDRNGYEVFSAARRLVPTARVILMTGFGYDPHHSIVRASQEGLQSVLFKPFEIEALVSQVRKALTESAEKPKKGE
ncbi:MAG: GAF domain-containing protein [Phycisphaerales bacterium]